MKKVMLIYPPGKLYQRGEDRSQGNVEDSTATSVRAANDLGYGSASLQDLGYKVFLKDYQTKQLTLQDLTFDLKIFNPDVLFVSITNTTIFQDIEIVKLLKEIKKDLVIILKGALFFDPYDKMLSQLDLDQIDYLIGGESEFSLSELIDYHFKNPAKIETIKGILYKKKFQNKMAWVPTDFSTWEQDLDKLKFPDRNKMDNSLYLRPDTGEPQATIVTSRGCAASCIYCLTPKISGKKIRFRSPENIVSELRDCFNNHNIRNFFFRSDTFTMDHKWVKEVCERILDTELNGKIEWVANSRVNPLKYETLQYMKKAGCWLVAFGFESGSLETLSKIKKGAKPHHNIKAAQWCREVGLKTYGFFLIGLPWENWSNLEDTRLHIYDLDCDFIELHIAVPYFGTELYNVAREYGVIDGSPLGRDYFNAPTVGTKYLDIEDIENFRKNVLLKYHLRPKYVYRRLWEGLKNPKIMKNYIKFGTKVLYKNGLSRFNKSAI